MVLKSKSLAPSSAAERGRAVRPGQVEDVEGGLVPYKDSLNMFPLQPWT
jgi:hypothetical protein